MLLGKLRKFPEGVLRVLLDLSELVQQFLPVQETGLSWFYFLSG